MKKKFDWKMSKKSISKKDWELTEFIGSLPGFSVFFFNFALKNYDQDFSWIFSVFISKNSSKSFLVEIVLANSPKRWLNYNKSQHFQKNIFILQILEKINWRIGPDFWIANWQILKPAQKRCAFWGSIKFDQAISPKVHF